MFYVVWNATWLKQFNSSTGSWIRYHANKPTVKTIISDRIGLFFSKDIWENEQAHLKTSRLLEFSLKWERTKTVYYKDIWNIVKKHEVKQDMIHVRKSEKK